MPVTDPGLRPGLSGCGPLGLLWFMRSSAGRGFVGGRGRIIIHGLAPCRACPGNNVMIDLVDHAIDTAALLEWVNSPQAGAVVLFLGTVRETTGGRRTVALDYECYGEMARKK